MKINNLPQKEHLTTMMGMCVIWGGKNSVDDDRIVAIVD